MSLPRVLTVAGSDSGGGAGIQADIKTITVLGAFATSAITALTAQNTTGVRSIHPVPPAFVRDQIDMVLGDIGTDAAKSGMLLSSETAAAVAGAFEAWRVPNYVLDPVLVSKSGALLLDREAIEVMVARLFPLARLVTPNVPEAEAITGMTIADETAAREAALRLHALGPAAVLVKGGHLGGAACTDLLYDGRRFQTFSSRRLDSRQTHGTGCTLSAAIAAFLARGQGVAEAVARARAFVYQGILLAPGLGRGWGPLGHLAAARAVESPDGEACAGEP